MRQPFTGEVTASLLLLVGVRHVATRLGATGAGSIAVVSAALLATYFLRRRGVRWSSLGLRAPYTFKAGLTVVLIAGFALVAMLSAQLLAVHFLVEVGGFSDLRDLANRNRVYSQDPIGLWTYIVFVNWIGAGFAEELLFRGFIMHNLRIVFRNRTRGWVVAILLQGVVFGLLHAYQGPIGMMATGLTGVALGAVYWLSNRSLVALIMAHGCYNTAYTLMVNA